MFFEHTLDTCVFQKTCTTSSDICNAGLYGVPINLLSPGIVMLF